jgi:putative ABC transport system permease protein
VKPDVTEAQAAADLTPIIDDLKGREPAQFPDRWRVGLLSFKETFPSSIRENLWVLFGAVGLLLLIACANVSNLLLSKATERQREMTVRAALGASRSSIVRQLLVESLGVACAAGAVGVALAAGGLQAILAVVPPDTIPDESEIALNLPVLAFTFAVSAVTSVIFGLAPALHATSGDLVSSLREASRSVSSGRRHAFMRKGLVVIEVALSLMLLVGAGLLIRTALAVEQVDLGFRADRVLTLRVPLPERRYPDRERRVAFFRELLGRVSRLPGVEGVGLNSGMHPVGNLITGVEVTGASQPGPQPAAVHLVSAGYPAALGIRLLHGRVFSESEVDRGLPLAIVNEMFVRTRLDGQPPLGRAIRIPRLAQPPFDVAAETFDVVGVVANTLNRGVTSEVVAEVYLPYSLAGRSDRLAVLARGDAASLTRATLGEVYAIDPEQPAMEVFTLDRALRDFIYAEPRFNVTLFSVFAAIGLVLAVIGIYGVMAASVAQQVHEMGVRLALGAGPGSVFRMVIGRGAWLLGLGILVGIAGSLLSARVLDGYVWRVSTVDPSTIAIVAAVLFAAGLQACVWPARRAAQISPIVALRRDS